MKNARRKQQVTKAQLAIRAGDLVDVTRDDGRTETRVAASDPWQLGHGDWVVKLDGISGGYDLARCQKMLILPPSAILGAIR